MTVFDKNNVKRQVHLGYCKRRINDSICRSRRDNADKASKQDFSMITTTA